MAKDKEYEKIKKQLKKSIGVTDLVQNGNQVTLTIDPSTLKPSERKKLFNSLGNIKPDLQKTNKDWDKWSRAEGQISNNSPYEASYFEGFYSQFAQLNAHQKMKMAMMYFRTEPLVGKTIELMKVFSNDGLTNSHPDKNIKAFYDQWGKAVGLDQVLGWLFLEYYRTGNVTTWRELIPYREGMFKSKLPPYSTEGAKKYSWKKEKMIPGAYTVLNPLTVYVSRANGYNDSLYYSQPMTDNELIEGSSPDDPTRLLLRQLPNELIKKLNETKEFKNIPLAEKNVRRIMRMRMPYESYGNILMERAFAPIHEKNKMRQMDMSMVNSLIAQIITVTVGNDDYPATPKQLRNLQDAFKYVGKCQILFWNHTLKVLVIRPDTKVLNKEKYARIDEDIRNAFGISEVLTGGGNIKTNFATAYLSLKAFLANLMEGRKDILRWLEQEYADIAEVMGFESYPIPRFNPLSLTDEVAEKQILMQLIDRGIISYESAQLRLGFDPQGEIEIKERELPLLEKGVLGMVGPGGAYQQSQQQQHENDMLDKQSDIDKQLAGADNDIKTKKEAANKINKDDKRKKPDTQQTQELIEERKQGTQVPSPSKIAQNPAPKKSATDGRPQTPKGNYPTQRKIAKIKGQGSEEETINQDQEQYDIDLILSKTNEILGK